MKRKLQQNHKITESWPGELTVSWHDFVTAIPSPLFLNCLYKSMAKRLFAVLVHVDGNGEFICIIGSVSRAGIYIRV